MRSRLTRFLSRGAAAERVGDLSGGERFRATLTALLADPARVLDLGAEAAEEV